MPRDELKQSLLKLLTNEFSINSSKVRSFFKFSWVFQRGFAALLIAFISITSSGWLVSTASAASIPGETLYPVKTFKEEIRFQIINSDAEKVKFRTELIQERVKEIELIIYG